MTVHKTKAYRGEHEAIIDERLWNEAQSINREPPRTRGRAAALAASAIATGSRDRGRPIGKKVAQK
jgi:site-specific DNA recombinase